MPPHTWSMQHRRTAPILDNVDEQFSTVGSMSFRRSTLYASIRPSLPAASVICCKNRSRSSSIPETRLSRTLFGIQHGQLAFGLFAACEGLSEPAFVNVALPVHWHIIDRLPPLREACFTRLHQAALAHSVPQEPGRRNSGPMEFCSLCVRPELHPSLLAGIELRQ